MRKISEKTVYNIPCCFFEKFGYVFIMKIKGRTVHSCHFTYFFNCDIFKILFINKIYKCFVHLSCCIEILAFILVHAPTSFSDKILKLFFFAYLSCKLDYFIGIFCFSVFEHFLIDRIVYSASRKTYYTQNNT